MGGKKELRDQEAGAVNDFPVNNGTLNCITTCSSLGWAAQGTEQKPMSSAEERAPTGQGTLCRKMSPPQCSWSHSPKGADMATRGGDEA